MAFPQGPNQVWGLDFVSDQLANGRRIRILCIVDLYSRECLALEADTSISGDRVSRVLQRLIETRGKPQALLSDNGPEFVCKAMQLWANDAGIVLNQIEPGKPSQNGFVESFNGKFRDDCLNENWFASLEEVRQIIENWRVEYNAVRPHSSLGYQTPEEFAANWQKAA